MWMELGNPLIYRANIPSGMWMEPGNHLQSLHPADAEG
jgi:hypothetical protein